MLGIADREAPHFKTGGMCYISENNDQFSDVLVADELNSTTISRCAGVIVPCRVYNEISTDLKPYCVSFVDPERPAWFLRHYKRYFSFEPEYAPRKAKTFDADASFIMKSLIPGFGALESYSKPNHYMTIAASDKRPSLSKFQETDEWKATASAYLIDSSIQGESKSSSLSPAVSCYLCPLCFCLSEMVNAVVTCEIKLFQNYFRSLLQLVNIFQRVQCR